jgi:transcriptional regulator with XRE-family HTH domain
MRDTARRVLKLTQLGDLQTWSLKPARGAFFELLAAPLYLLDRLPKTANYVYLLVINRAIIRIFDGGPEEEPKTVMEVGKRIREVRDDYGMSRNELARRVGVAGNHLYQIEAGNRTPSLGLLERVAHALRVAPAELVREGGLAKLEELLENPRVSGWLHAKDASFVFMGDADFEDEVVDGDPDEVMARLVEERDSVLRALERSGMAAELFPADMSAITTKQERLAEAMRPYRELTKLKALLAREYQIKERTVMNYIRHLSLIDAEANEGSYAGDEVRRHAFREERELASI